jgi:serine/threonine protein phosphatase 1
MSGKTVVVGHTPQDEVLDLDYLLGLDTGCCYGGWLTAMDIDTKQLWQADERGELRQ